MTFLVEMLRNVPAGTLFRADDLLELLNEAEVASAEAVRDLTAKDIASIEGVTEATVRRWFRNNEFPGQYRFKEREYRVSRSGYLEWQERQRRGLPGERKTAPATDIRTWKPRKKRGRSG